jgi:hypothetical protein
MSEVKAITPKELEVKPITFPDYVVNAFNKLIAEKYEKARLSGSKITFTIKQSEAIDEIMTQARLLKWKGVTKDKIFREHYLDVEKFYEQSGWKMVFDKPGWDENYEAYWTVSVK